MSIMRKINPDIGFQVSRVLLVVALTVWGVSWSYPLLAGPPSIDAFLKLRSASDPQISPDGSKLIYTRHSSDLMMDKRTSVLVLTDMASGASTDLGTGRDVHWSPGGDQFAFFRLTPEGATELVALPASANAEPRVLTSLYGFPRGLAWSPDGAKLAFRSVVPASDVGWDIPLPPPPEGARWTPEPHVIDKLPYQLDGIGYHYQYYEHLFVIDAAAGELRQLTKGNWHVGAKPGGLDMGTRIDWTADSESIVFDGIGGEYSEVPYGRSNIYKVEVASGEITRVNVQDGFWVNPVVSPDGHQIAYAGHGTQRRSYRSFNLWVSGIDGSGVSELTAALDRDVSNVAWRDDSDAIFFNAHRDGSVEVFSMTMAGDLQQLTDGRHALYLGSVSATGKAAASISLPTRPPEIVVFGANQFDGFQFVSALNDSILADVPIGDVSEIRAKSADGTEIQGWTVKPFDFEEGRAYPLILEIHGGPHDSYHAGFSRIFQALAAEGYVVVYANPRGSAGYGTEFGDAIHNEFPGKRDYEDLMAIVDAAIELPYVDAGNLFVTGCSAGGTMTAWIVSHTDRFRAGAANCMISDWISYAGSADVLGWSMRRFDEPFWKNPDLWLRHSPVMRVAEINTPLLLMTGEKDLRTPPAQAQLMFAALRAEGVPTRLVLFPTESHGTTEAPSNFMRTMLYITSWFEQWSVESLAAADRADGRE